MKHLLHFCGLLLVIASINAYSEESSSKVYKFVDENGVTHYTDAPTAEQSSAEEQKIDVTPAVTFGPIIKTRKKFNTSNQQAHNNTLKVTITSPSNDEAVRANDGSMTIKSTAVPSLPRGTLYQLQIDGTVINTQASGLFMLNQVNRGTHTAIVKITNRNGKVLATSETVTFHLLKVSGG